MSECVYSICVEKRMLFNRSFFSICIFYISCCFQGDDKGKGQNDGSFLSRTYFNCSKNSGVFAPFTRVKPINTKTSTSPNSSTELLEIGDRVAFFDENEKAHHGMVLDIVDDKGIKKVVISTVSTDFGS